MIDDFIPHPEQKEDEVLITNTHEIGVSSFETVRYGTQAFDVFGNLVIGARPVFVKTEELERSGLHVDAIRNWARKHAGVKVSDRR